jgi:hypothetical protein
MKFAMITFAAAVSALIAAAAIDLGSVVQSDIDLVSSAFAIVGDSLGEKVESLSLVQPTSLRRGEADIDQSAGPLGYSKCFVDASDDDGEHENQYVKTEQKLVFVHIPKNAGTTMVAFIKNHQKMPIRICGHWDGANCVGKDRAIVVLRNPYHRFESAVHHAITEYSDETFIRPLVDAGFTTANDWASHLDMANLEMLNSDGKHTIDGRVLTYGWTYSPQYEWFHGLVDPIVLRYEHLEHDWEQMCKTMGLPIVPLSKRLTYGHLKTKSYGRVEAKSYDKPCFSTRTCEYVERVYADDLKLIPSQCPRDVPP